VTPGHELQSVLRTVDFTDVKNMQNHIRSFNVVVVFTSLLLTLVAPRLAAADTLTLMWDANPAPQVAGYIAHVGTQSGTYTQHFDVGQSTAFTFSSAVAGQRYCFAVSSYATGPIEGAKSGEVCGYSNASPLLVNPGARQSTVGQASSLQLSGSDPDGQPVTYSATGVPSGLVLMASTGFISGTPTSAGSNTVTATVSDGVLTASQAFTWTIVAASDTTVPTVTIAAPTSATTYVTTSATATLSGAASDNVAVTQVSWVNNRGGSGTATGTTNWSTAAITLQTGSNVLTMTSRDAAGNTSSDVLTVTRNVAADTTAPTVTIAAPTSATTYVTTSATTTLSGSASDNVAVTQVSWVNNRGGSGTATGTTNWSTAAITLQTGSNVLTMTSRDAAGNTGSDVLTVTRNVASDTAAPSVTIAGPTSAATYTASTATLVLSGTSADNVGVTQVTWLNSRGGSGTAAGTTNWSVASVTLQSGTNVITVTARDAAGNTATDVLTVTSAATALQFTGITANRVSPQPAGTAITFTATATGGTAPYQYKFWLSDGGTTYVIARDWATSNTFTWTPTTANPSHSVGVWIRNAGSTADAYDAALVGSMPFAITAAVPSGPLQFTGITANRTAPQAAGTPVIFTATATGGTAPHQYKFWLFNGTTWSIARDWATSNTLTWTPGSANANYMIGVWVRNAGSSADGYDAALTGSMAFPVQ
jgi:hypothetical protein